MNIYLSFAHQPLWFRQPRELISCTRPAELMPALRRIESWLDAGCYAAGFLSYEAGYAFEPRLYTPRKADFPLLQMGAYGRPVGEKFRSPGAGRYRLRRLQLNTPYGPYADAIRRIRNYIAAGDVYQVTYCLKYRFQFSGDPGSLFADLYRAQPVPYSAFIETDSFRILCLSPERFIRKRNGCALTEPMKGTWPRGNNFFSDWKARRQFSRDEKNLAENVMIADLLRNDLGRIGKSIKAPKLFTITKYRTLYQMTSTVTGIVPGRLAFGELLAALFPSGSVTGAPKIRAMEIIREIEREDRKIYTGAIGYIAPNRDMYFNIPIRTLLIQGARGEMGVGGGIVWDSTPRGEWEEGRLKARFLREKAEA